MTEELNFKVICNLTTRVMGLEKGSLSLKSRKRNIQVCRSIAAYIGLTEEDIPRKSVANVFIRDRCITYHYEKYHKKNFHRCEIYRNAFQKIFKKYKNIDGEKDIFVNKRQMKNHLLQNKVMESKNSDVILQVKSGDILCDINTTYFDFSNQAKNIDKAMENYHYSIKII